MANLNKLSTSKNNDDNWLSLTVNPSNLSHRSPSPSPPHYSHTNFSIDRAGPSAPPPPPSLSVHYSDTEVLHHFCSGISCECETQKVVSEPVSDAVLVIPTTDNNNNNNNNNNNSNSSFITNIPPPFPWATDRRGIVHTIDYLLANGITVIAGEVQCKRCERKDKIAYNLVAKYKEVREFVLTEYHEMHDRAPPQWMNPVFGTCRGGCGEKNCVKPVMAEKKRGINWLFLFLGQMLGVCTLKQLKYLCKHTQNHRTGAKDRVLFLAYIAICKQLEPGVSEYLRNKKDSYHKMMMNKERLN